MWAGIKHALNSTLGTSEFQPLDRIIKGQRTLGASDNTIAVISNQETSGSFSFPISFVPKVGGIVRIIANAQSLSGEKNIAVRKDGAVIVLLTFEDTAQPITKRIDFSVSADSVYTFSQDNNMISYEIKIGASVIDGSLFSVEEV